MAKKKKEAVVQDVKGSHLTVHADGTLAWDWDALLKEVQAATAGKGRDLIAETETKVKRSRSKKTK
ncbi:MAG: hypothetical protein ACO29M_04915 [Fluviibacter sp.]